ncbi:unnamed protein product [Symbiodinium sp. CCMP2592]|nr:unnamed protein product [Symbiodinium sp. CCMP2592]
MLKGYDGTLQGKEMFMVEEYSTRQGWCSGAPLLHYDLDSCIKLDEAVRHLEESLMLYETGGDSDIDTLEDNDPTPLSPERRLLPPMALGKGTEVNLVDATAVDVPSMCQDVSQALAEAAAALGQDALADAASTALQNMEADDRVAAATRGTLHSLNGLAAIENQVENDDDSAWQLAPAPPFQSAQLSSDADNGDSGDGGQLRAQYPPSHLEERLMPNALKETSKATLEKITSLMRSNEDWAGIALVATVAQEADLIGKWAEGCPCPEHQRGPALLLQRGVRGSMMHMVQDEESDGDSADFCAAYGRQSRGSRGRGRLRRRRRRDSAAAAECSLKGLRAPEMSAGQALDLQLSVMQGRPMWAV